VLDVPGDMLVAEAEGERQLAAVEGVQNGVYAIFKLSKQLKMRMRGKQWHWLESSNLNLPTWWGWRGAVES